MGNNADNKNEELDYGVKKLSAIYCNGYGNDYWISLYNIHRDADKPAEITVRKMIEKISLL